MANPSISNTMSPKKTMDTITFENTATPSQGGLKKDKGRKFFHQIEPTFAVRVPNSAYTELQFLDNFDPGKDTIIRKKAREWVNRNKERAALGAKPNLKPKTSTGKAGSEEQEKQLAKRKAISKALVVSPRSVSANSIDPFGLLPDVGRNIDHIIRYCMSAFRLTFGFSITMFSLDCDSVYPLMTSS
jgi:hypothetical protein